MNQQLQHRLLSYALIAVVILSIFYLLSAFGLFSLYPHFLGDSHPHRWHTLFRLCFVAFFAVVNHWVLVPQLYLKKQHLLFFSIVLLVLVSVWVVPDMVLKMPKPEFLKLRQEHRHLPPFQQILLIELAHVYLLLFISTFTSIAVRTRQYMQQIEQDQLETIENIKQEIAQKQFVETENSGAKQEELDAKKTETALTVTVNYSLIRIEFSEILFIKSMDNYLQFHLKDKKPILVRMTLKEATEKLPTERFLRIHKSYIVAISAIESIRNKTILITKNEIPIGKTYEESVSNIFA